MPDLNAEQILEEKPRGFTPTFEKTESTTGRSADDILSEKLSKIPPEPPPPPLKPSLWERAKGLVDLGTPKRELAPRQTIIPEEGQSKGKADDFGYVLGETREIKGVKGVKDGTYKYIGSDKWKLQKAE